MLSNKVNYWTGNECREFEKEFADWSQSKYSIALSNGTVALDLAFKALSIGEGDEVIAPECTWIGSVACISYQRATTVFADIDIESGNISIASIKKLINKRKKLINRFLTLKN